MRFVFSLIGLVGVCYGVLKIAPNGEDFKDKIGRFLHHKSLPILEMHYTAEQICQAHRKELLKNEQYQWVNSSLKFYPYLLLEVKYAVSRSKTKEGIMLWDLREAEMILDGEKWQKTEGFRDCILSALDRNEFKVLQALARVGGRSDLGSLAKALKVEIGVVEKWVDQCCQKKLILSSRNGYRLHFEDPQLKITPSTRLAGSFIIQSHHDGECMSKRFSSSQIEQLIHMIFGEDFIIRNVQDVYLPVHCIVVKDPDGSLHSSHWNGFTGKRFAVRFFH